MKVKVRQHRFNVHYRGSPQESRTQQHAYCLRYAQSQFLGPHINVSLREHPVFSALVLKLEARAEKTGCSRRLINVGVVFFTLFLTARNVFKSVLHVQSYL